MIVGNLRPECETNHCMRHGNFVGAQQLVHQLATSHVTLAKNTCHSLKHCNFWKVIFKIKCYQEPLTSFIEVAHFGCFDTSVIMQDKGGERHLNYDTTWRIKEFLVWTKYCKNFKLLYMYIWKKQIWFDLQFCTKN
jgi:hypothetical protein